MECTKTCVLIFTALVVSTAGFVLTLTGWFAPPLNNFVDNVRLAGPVILLIGFVIMLISCATCSYVQGRCCLCCYKYTHRKYSLDYTAHAHHQTGNGSAYSRLLLLQNEPSVVVADSRHCNGSVRPVWEKSSSLQCSPNVKTKTKRKSKAQRSKLRMPVASPVSSVHILPPALDDVEEHTHHHQNCHHHPGNNQDTNPPPSYHHLVGNRNSASPPISVKLDKLDKTRNKPSLVSLSPISSDCPFTCSAQKPSLSSNTSPPHSPLSPQKPSLSSYATPPHSPNSPSLSLSWPQKTSLSSHATPPHSPNSPSLSLSSPPPRYESQTSENTEHDVIWVQQNERNKQSGITHAHNVFMGNTHAQRVMTSTPIISRPTRRTKEFNV